MTKTEILIVVALLLTVFALFTFGEISEILLSSKALGATPFLILSSPPWRQDAPPSVSHCVIFHVGDVFGHCNGVLG
ncbi:hypothetical protein [Rhizobium sp. CNPSo 3490]|uniref:hypothetical protein n=1 Tax=Rhizobium sp. CNPSo 3490 TaxID=3021407 RepID=UPI00254BF4A1|nr:hypothetical protein [Rhizobium sp. CNPSo 3490]MDK4731567.1 hypothetical protein [Rhizobium sp. CNPSo 3490]